MNTLTKLISKQITAMEIDGETMEQIIREAGMEEQMLRQLVMTMPLELTQRLMTEKMSLSDIVILERGDDLNLRMRADRDTLIVEVAGDNYNRLMREYNDELCGMLGVSDYIANVVDIVMSSDEYTEAVQYERDNKGTRWEYMQIEHNNCLDWYFLDKANALIESDYPRLKLLSMNDSAGNTLNIGDEVVLIDDLDLEGDAPKIGDVLVVYTCVDLSSNYISFNEGKYAFFGHRVLKINKG